MIVSNGSLGKVTVTDISKGTYTYTPNAQTTGTDTFTFKVNDGQADSNIATVVVTIQTSLRSTNIPLPPPNYSSFIPPKVGASYSDPTFGTTVKRLTDSGKVELGVNEVSYFNNNDSYFIAVDNGLTYLMDGLDSRKIKVLEGKTMKPWYIRWPRANSYKASGVAKSFDPTQHFYKIEGNEIRLYNIDSLSYTLLRKFDEYTEIGPVGGRSEISEGGRHWLLDGKKPDGKQALFIYDLVGDLKGAECPFDPGVIANSKSPGVHFGTVSPSGKYVVLTWNTGSSSSWNDHFGVEAFDRSTWKLVRRVIPIWTKFELGYDSSGQEMFFAMAGNSLEDIKSLKIPDLALGDLISVRLADGVGKKLLDVPLRAGYSLAYATRQKNFVFLSMEANSTSPEKQWAPYWGEILAVSTDGSGKVVRLVHHRSRQVGSYSYSPNFIVNNKGTKIVYKSTYGIGGPDLYMIFVNLQ
jgi:hypothetical protein